MSEFSASYSLECSVSAVADHWFTDRLLCDQKCWRVALRHANNSRAYGDRDQLAAAAAVVKPCSYRPESVRGRPAGRIEVPRLLKARLMLLAERPVSLLQATSEWPSRYSFSARSISASVKD